MLLPYVTIYSFHMFRMFAYAKNESRIRVLFPFQSCKLIAKGSTNDSRKETQRDSQSDSLKDARKDSQKDSQKDSRKDSQKDTD